MDKPRPRYNPAIPHQRSRLPVTEAGENLIAALQRLKSDVDSALSLAVSELGRYVDQDVRPLESGTPPRTPTPLTDRRIRREIAEALGEQKKTA